MKRKRGRNRCDDFVRDSYIVVFVINIITCGQNVTGLIHRIFGLMKAITGDGQTVIFAGQDVNNLNITFVTRCRWKVIKNRINGGDVI